jgi:hypothetical protein
MHNKSRFYKSATLALCLLGFSPALVFAGTPEKKIERHGTIQTVDTTNHTLVLTERKNATEQFQWNDQTQFVEHNKNVSASALKQGEHVKLTYYPGGTTPTLQSVHINAKAEKRHAETHSAVKNNRAHA